jgi:DNA-binding NarL/FixJ family response regulator
MTVRVIAVEDDARYRGSLELLLRYSGDFAFVQGFGSPDDAVAEAERQIGAGRVPRWDLALMDLELPGVGGVEGTRRLKSLLPSLTVVILTVFEERDTILQAICAGADGYLVKRTAADQILVQLRSVLAGGAPLSAGVARTVLDLVRRGEASDGSPSRLDLTEREQEVLRRLVEGMSYKQAAAELGISLDTVRSHIRRIYSKLQVHSVGEAVSRAIRERMV